MTARIVQSGSGDERDLAVVYHLTSELDSLVRGALPPETCILNVTEPPGQLRYLHLVSQGGVLLPLADLLRIAQQGGVFGLRSFVAVGFSEGCQGVRAHLLAGSPLDGAVAIDGTHGDLPEPADWQIAPWKSFFEKATAEGSRSLYVATHSMIDTEHIPPPAHAYMRGQHMLQRITGFPCNPGTDALLVGRDARLLAVTSGRAPQSGVGSATVYSFGGHDAAAHVFQAKHALPAVLAGDVTAFLRRMREPESGPTTQPSAREDDPMQWKGA